MPAAWIVLIGALWLVVLLLAVLVLGLVRRVSQLEAVQLTISPANAPNTPYDDQRLAPGAMLPIAAEVERLWSGDRGRAKRLFLVLSSRCGPCRKLADELREGWRTGEMVDELELVVITDPDGVASYADLGASDIVAQTAGQVSRAWGVPGTPFAVAVDASGLISASGFARTPAGLREIAETLEAGVL
jgi:hypothetical protein